MEGDKVQRIPFPEGGPPSPLLCTEYPNPYWLYLTAFCFWSGISLFRWLVLFLCDDGGTIIMYWNMVDCVLMLSQALWVFWHLMVSHHRWRYVDAEPYGDVSPEDITHVLTILHATEPAQQLYNLVSDLKALACDGKKVLMIGMEAVTPEIEEKMATIKKDHGDAFEKILYTVHKLRRGEIVGTGSNHFETQVGAEIYFANMEPEVKSNVIFSKFDTNMKLDKDGMLLREIESVWCMVDPETRKCITFMPNLYWSADVQDRLRNYMEMFVSFSMSTLLQQASFSMAFVSGSLEGVTEIGYTPPALLAEDDLTFTKKQVLLRKPRTYRLCSAILKVFVTGKDIGKRRWTLDFLDKKMKRWMLGHVEKDIYMTQWLCCRRCCLRNFDAKHPPIRNKLRAVGCLLTSLLRMYLIFALPLNVVPCVFFYLPGVWKEEEYDFKWLTILEILPDVTPYMKLRVPYGVVNVLPETRTTAIILFLGFWFLAIGAGLSLGIMMRIQVRIYRSFKFLKFNWRTLALYGLVFMPVLLLMGPLFLLWSFLKHGCRNRPAGHVMLVGAGAGHSDTDASTDDDGDEEEVETLL